MKDSIKGGVVDSPEFPLCGACMVSVQVEERSSRAIHFETDTGICLILHVGRRCCPHYVEEQTDPCLKSRASYVTEFV